MNLFKKLRLSLVLLVAAFCAQAATETVNGITSPIITSVSGQEFYGDFCTVTITSETEGSTIYYTTNGITPRKIERNRYSKPFMISSTATVKAFSVKNGEASNIESVTFVKKNILPVAPDIKSLEGSEFYGDSCMVTITSETVGTTIYYSICDVTNTNPLFENIYIEPFHITDTKVIHAYATFKGKLKEVCKIKDEVTIGEINVGNLVFRPDNLQGRYIGYAGPFTTIKEAQEAAGNLENWDFGNWTTIWNDEGRSQITRKMFDNSDVRKYLIDSINVALVEINSDVVSEIFYKRELSISVALDAPELQFTTGGDAQWVGSVYDSAKIGQSVAQSGVLLWNENIESVETWMETTVCGSGVFSFWWKVDCEDDPWECTWDRLMVYTNGVEVARIDGKTEWEQVIFNFTGPGPHTIRWKFYKDDWDDEKLTDLAWVDGVVWTPIAMDITVDLGGEKSVVVPVEWIDSHADIVAAAGGDKAAALHRTAANGRKVWECYVLGLDPTDPSDDFRITRFWMEDGAPKFEFSHATDGSGNSFLPYVKPLGKAQLSDKWRHVPEGGNPAFRFFTVEVVPPGCESSIVDEEDLGGVQLWENGPYWAECNVGATKPEEYGYYFWWGDTVGYTNTGSGWISVKDGTSISFSGSGTADSTYRKDNAELLSLGYIDSTGNLAPVHDAATAHLGSPWRMPTTEEISALVSKCITTWTTRNGVYGRLVTGKGAYSDKSIFLPAAGYGYALYLDLAGLYGSYWSSTPYSGISDRAWYLGFDSGDFREYYYYYSRYDGLSVRPVREFAK